MTYYKLKKIRAYLGTTVFLAIIFFGWQIFNFSAFYLITKNLQTACLTAGQNLTTAPLNESIARLNNCQDQISQLSGRLVNIQLSTFGLFNGTIADFNKFLSGLYGLAEDGKQIAGLNSRFRQLNNQTNFWPFVLTNFAEVNDLAQKTSTDQQQIVDALNGHSLIAYFLRHKYAGYLEKINKSQELLGQAGKYLDLISWAGGFDGEKTFLIFFQNSSELRPTGGFWGSYGIIQIKNGQIVMLFTDDIYHLDTKLIGNKKLPPAPEPITKYLKTPQWFLRDANWSPDFPTTVKTTLEFYKQLGGNIKIDGVIAINPQLIEDALGVLGPITLNNQQYNRENFLTDLQYQVEIGYKSQNIRSWDRKDIIQALAQKLIDQIPNSLAGLSDLSAIANLLNDNLTKKNLLLYAVDTTMQKKIWNYGWSGALLPFGGDYLMVVDSNLASLKTDPYIDRALSYQVTTEKNDQGNVTGLIGHLTITYSHRGNFDWKTTRYRTYTRVYAPLGSTLIKTSGAIIDDKTFAVASGDTYTELGKTVFGAFIAVEPKKTGTLEFSWRMPETVFNMWRSGAYNLYLQKQSGADNQTVNLNLECQNQITGVNSANQQYTILGKQINWPAWGFLADQQFHIDCR